MEKVLADINRHTRNKQTIQVLTKLEPNLIWRKDAKNLFTSGSLLVLGGPMKTTVIAGDLNDKGDEVYIFDTCLLVCRCQHNKYEELITLPIHETILVPPEDGSPATFTIKSSQGDSHVVFHSTDKHICRHWISNYQDALKMDVNHTKKLTMCEVAKERRRSGSNIGTIRRRSSGAHLKEALAEMEEEEHSSSAPPESSHLRRSGSSKALRSSRRDSKERVSLQEEDPPKPLSEEQLLQLQRLSKIVLSSEQLPESLKKDVAKFVKNASPDAADGEGRTLMHAAAFSNNVDLVAYLIGKGAAVDLEDSDGWTPLMSALNEGNTKTAQVLLSHGASAAVANRRGQTPLHLLTKCRHLDDASFDILTTLLRTQGLDVNLRSSDGKTALFMGCTAALNAQRIALLERLLQAGADPNIVDKEEKTPLARATLTGNTKVIDLLLEHGANPMLGSRGGSALDIAKGSGNAAFVAKFEAARKCQEAFIPPPPMPPPQ
eukprot:TRINITY_DN9191_c0_g1_i1.p1 TRINITY_DN9191_c0_g1~~TRINITY_DN9191_c0_g1_i1.p1  ORF type:complete len:490 (+),score=134.15 TRINITY_DN9191_c0_g1_i1:981-2450(+)